MFLGLNRARGGVGPPCSATTSSPARSPASGRCSTLGTSQLAQHRGLVLEHVQADQDLRRRQLPHDALRRQHHQFETVFDVAPQFAPTRSSADAQQRRRQGPFRHPAHHHHLRDARLRRLSRGHPRLPVLPKIGNFNECSVDKSGRWLMSLEDVDYKYDLEMRIFNLATGTERLVWTRTAPSATPTWATTTSSRRSVEHLPNAILSWTSPRTRSPVFVHHNTDWPLPLRPHLHANARAGVRPPAVRLRQRRLARRRHLGNESSASTWTARSRSSSSLRHDRPERPGGGSDDYVKQPKGNLDLTGQYFIWTSNTGAAVSTLRRQDPLPGPHGRTTDRPPRPSR